MVSAELCAEDNGALIAIPTFNNRTSLRAVVEKALETGLPVLVVNDGSTDGGLDTLAGLDFNRVDFTENQGKGAAIIAAGEWAFEHGFSHVITLDADGQHDPADVVHFLERIGTHPHSIVIGARDLSGAAVPGSSRFGRSFSNFWVRVACGTSQPDSQSGFRAYPVEILREVKCLRRRYDFEIEVLVRGVWAGASLESVPITVYYDDQTVENSHFDKFRDNVRISLLFTRLVARNLTPWPHKVLDQDRPEDTPRLSIRRPRQSISILLREACTPLQISVAAALGIFLGTLPLIGCHCVAIVFCATRLKLNRLVALNISHLCAPPLVPAMSLEVGYYVRHGHFLTEFTLQTLAREAHHRFFEYLVGSIILAPVLAIVVGGVVYLLAWFYQRLNARRSAEAHG